MIQTVLEVFSYLFPRLAPAINACGASTKDSMDAKELLARYAAGERKFIGADLNGASLKCARLCGANLRNANLSDANLVRSRLINADLRDANLSGANLTLSRLINADLRNANLSSASLKPADLTDADLRNANLNGASLTMARLRGADLRNANLNATNLSRAKLISAKLCGANLSNANLRLADLTGAELSGAEWNGIILASQTILEELQQQNRGLIDQINALKALLDKQKRELEASQKNVQTNQGVNARYRWNNLRFRSGEEIKIAQAFDRVEALFYPNCKARLNTSLGRENKETDFLVFYQGKWGILEVDGEPWHPSSRVVHDHERDRLFKIYGIRVVEHYDSNRCFQQPDEVVREFLEILKQA